MHEQNVLPVNEMLIKEDFIHHFLTRYQTQDWKDARSHWQAAIRIPENIGSMLRIKLAIIIDEFQDLKHSVYNEPP